jgi:hypothetical protein
VAQVEGLEIDLRIKGKSGILQSMQSRSEFGVADLRYESLKMQFLKH